MPVPNLISDLDTNANNNSPPGTESAKGNIDNYLRAAFAFIKQSYNLTAGSTAILPSAASVAIGGAAVNNITISGTTTITSFDNVAEGTLRFINFSGAMLLTYNATSLILPGAANITTSVNDSAIFKSLGGGNWQCLFYQYASAAVVLASSINGGQLAGMRNKIINGGMQVSQRGTVTFTATNNLYGGADRMLTSISATTVSALALTASIAQSSTGVAHQVGNVATTGTTLVQVSQRLEAAITSPLNGKTITMSAKILQSTGSTQTLTTFLQKANALNNFNAQTGISSTTTSIPNNVVTPVSLTVTLGASDGTNGLQAAFAYIGLPAQATTQFYFFDFQLEIGAIATPFEVRDYTLELLLSQRYYYQGLPPIKGFLTSTSSISRANCAHPVKMRAAPTVAFSGTVTIFDGVTTSSLATIAGSTSSVDVLELDYTVSPAVLTNGRGASVIQSNGVITASAEL